MLIVVLGCSGIGLVWGWLIGIGRLDEQAHRSFRNVFAVIIATLIIFIEVILLANWHALLFFLAAVAFSRLFHLWWHRELYNRFGPFN